MQKHFWTGLAVVSVLTIFGAGVVPWVVERSRADRDARVQDGYEAGKAGIPVESSPYGSANTMGDTGRDQDWKAGWRKGYLERQQEKESPK